MKRTPGNRDASSRYLSIGTCDVSLPTWLNTESPDGATTSSIKRMTAEDVTSFDAHDIGVRHTLVHPTLR